MSAMLEFDALVAGPAPVLALAPMQDVTDLPFWRLVTQYGGADLYYTEYFRVYPNSHLDKHILASLIHNPTGRPAIAQMIGNDIPSLVRSAKELLHYNIAAVDLNLGCPAPVVYRKCAGGGLLRDIARVDGILGALRDAIPGRFTVKTRLGFENDLAIDALLPLFAKHGVDLVTIHGRTVLQMYRGEVSYPRIADAVRALGCPVLANGNVSSAKVAQSVLAQTGCRGLMLGRGVIRNPWLFSQIRSQLAGEAVALPSGRDVLRYIEELYAAVCSPDVRESAQVQKMKKYLNFIAAGIDSPDFQHDIRRCSDRATFFGICKRTLDHDLPMPLEPLVPANSAEEERESS
jgi:tRNA-dihydrouridine synthase B